MKSALATDFRSPGLTLVLRLMLFTHNRSALITGASAGIGLELARQMAPRVASLVLLARRVERLQSLAAELQASNPALHVYVEPCDLAVSSNIDELVSRLESRRLRIDILVNNAGFGEQALVESADWEHMRRMIDVNICALVQLTRLLLPGMVQRQHGGILNIGSGAGRAAMPNAAIYTASKHFVKAFTESLRAQVEGTGVIVTEAAPGPVESEFGLVAGLERREGAVQRTFRITANECARETLAAFERGQAVIYPGRNYRWIMRGQPLMPRRVLHRVLARSARELRNSGNLRASTIPVENNS